MKDYKKTLERLLNPRSFADYQLSITLPRDEAIALLKEVSEFKAGKPIVIMGNSGSFDFYKEFEKTAAESFPWLLQMGEEKQQPVRNKDHFEPRRPCNICKYMNVDAEEYPCNECKHNPHTRKR